MVITLMILAGLFIAGLITILVSRTILSVSLRNTRLKISMTVIGCGLDFDSRDTQLVFSVGRISQNIKPFITMHRPPFSVMVKIVKAGILCVARILSRVQYEEGRLEWQPVIANPALAGMAFGWGQALGGIFPGHKETFEFNPACGTGTGSFSGKAVFSIKNRQMVYVMWRLLRDLPIKEIIKHRFFKKR